MLKAMAESGESRVHTGNRYGRLQRTSLLSPTCRKARNLAKAAAERSESPTDPQPGSLTVDDRNPA